MKNSSVLVVLALLGFLLFPSCNKVVTEPGETTYDLTVIVTDEASRPIRDAVVKVDKTEKETDAEGKCTFLGLKAKTVLLTVSAEYYQPVYQSVTLEGHPKEPLTVTLSKGDLYVTVDTGQIDTKEKKFTQRLQIRSNTDWRIETSSPELSFSPTEGYGDQTVLVSWSFSEEQENEDLAVAEFTIVSSAEPVTVPVRYHLPIRIVKSEGIAANLAVDPKACNIARLTFSRKVVPEEAWENYDPVEFQSVDDHTVDILIPPGWSNLGATFSIDRVKVKSADGDGVVFDQSVSLDFFDDYAEIDGVMRHLYLSKDESRLWVSTSLPNRIYELDARTFEVRKSFDLDWGPGALCLNPYNNLLYAVGDSTLRVLNPVSGALVKTVTVEPDELDHPQSPNTIVENILFADNGLGVLVATSVDNTYRWHFIDSRRNDELERNPCEKEYGWDMNYTFSNVYLDHSRTKMISMPMATNAYQRTLIIDSADKTVTYFDVDHYFGTPVFEGAGGNIHEERTHKEKDLVFFCAPYSSVVYDYGLKTYFQAFTDHDMRWSFMDFCYGERFGEDICTYLFYGVPAAIGIRWKLVINNHSSHTTPFETHMAFQGGYAQDAIPFLEGDRLVLASTDGNGKTCFVTINTSRFFPSE